MWQLVAAAAVQAAIRKLQRRGQVHGWMQKTADEMDPEAMANPMYEASINPNVGVGAGQSGLLGDFIKGLAGGAMMSKIGGGATATNLERGAMGTWRQLESGKSLANVQLNTQAANITQNLQRFGIDTTKLFNMVGQYSNVDSWNALVKAYLQGNLTFGRQ